MPSEQPPIQLSITLPEHKQVGTYADFVSVWHTQTSFVLDFVSTTQPPQPVVDDDGQTTHVVVGGRIAQRLRIPPEQIFPLMQALNAQSTAWLAETGKSEPPEAWLDPSVHGV